MIIFWWSNSQVFETILPWDEVCIKTIFHVNDISDTRPAILGTNIKFYVSEQGSLVRTDTVLILSQLSRIMNSDTSADNHLTSPHLTPLTYVQVGQWQTLPTNKNAREPT